MNLSVLKLIKITISIIMIGVTGWGCVFLARLFGVQSLGFAICVNLLLMGASAGVLGLINPALTSTYFAPRAFEKEGRVYRWFGVQYFPLLLRVIGSEQMRRQAAPIRKDESSLTQFSRRTKMSETSHGCVALMVAVLSIYVATAYSIDQSKWLMATNIVFNVYPVMLQRYNRPRVERILRAMVNKRIENNETVLH